MYKILVIEDDLNFQKLISSFLETKNYQVVVANDGMEGILAFQQENFDLIIVDVMLPILDGHEVTQLIRKKSTVPIIMLTSLSEETNQVEGFNGGIDDYILKPISFVIFLKRVEAILKRTYGGENPQILTFNEIKINLAEHKVTVANEEIELTSKEYLILVELMNRPKQVFTREQLLNKVWGYDFIGDTNIVNQHIKNLRKKLNLPIIKSVKNVGYKIDD